MHSVYKCLCMCVCLHFENLLVAKLTKSNLSDLNHVWKAFNANKNNTHNKIQISYLSCSIQDFYLLETKPVM